MRIQLALLLTTTLSAIGSGPTFNREIAPILHKNCASCHRPGEAAPFSLLTYEDAKKKSATLAKAVHSRIMPPWKAEPVSFPYRNERRLTDEQIALIETWASSGAPEGDPKDKPTPPTFASGWMLGEPDLVIEMPKAFNVPADGPDIYRNIGVPLGINEDKWLTAIDMKPTARATVHHVLYFADPKAKAHEKQVGDQPGWNGMRPSASVALGGWAVGAQPSFFPENLALKVPANSDLVVQYHFHPSGKPESEKSLIGLYFAKEPPQRTLTRIQMPPHYSLFSGLNIPPGKKDYVIKDSYLLPVDIEAVGVSAHAHYIAKEMKMTANLPSGETRTLLHIKDWDFAWQDRYYFEKFQLLPKDTFLEVEIHWDNSAENPRNPSSPPIRVVWGEATKDEMGSVSLIAVPKKESDLRALKNDISEREKEVVQDRLKNDPALGIKLFQLLSE